MEVYGTAQSKSTVSVKTYIHFPPEMSTDFGNSFGLVNMVHTNYLCIIIKDLFSLSRIGEVQCFPIDSTRDWRQKVEDQCRRGSLLTFARIRLFFKKFNIAR